MDRYVNRTTLRIDNNLKARIKLLAIENNLSFNKMITYIIELGYLSYIKKFENNVERSKISEENKNI